MADDFYVGYLPQAPPPIGQFVRRAVVLLVVGAGSLALVLAFLQQPFDPGRFEFGIERDFEGRLVTRPYPALEVAVDDGSSASFFLVSLGKHGAANAYAAPDVLEALDGRRVRARGTLIERQGQAMIELVDRGLQDLESRDTASSVARDGPGDTPEIGIGNLGMQTLRGEIVDSKCFLGVMKPGRGKAHRACAALCIRGGIPPMLRVETLAGEYRNFLLTDQHGKPVHDRVLDLVAEPVEITGRVIHDRDRYLLQADPSTIRRLR